MILSTSTKEEFIKPAIKYSEKDAIDVKMKLVISRNPKVIKSNKYFMIKMLDIYINDYVDGIEFIFKD